MSAVARPLDNPEPAPAERRGACPTLARPMQTGDGLLARLRPLDGRLSLPELRALAAAAVEFGNGIIEITARGSLQVRGLKPETVAPFEAAIFASGIDVLPSVMVETPPLAGMDPEEVIDVRPLATELRRRVAEHLPALVLAPKLSVVLDGGGRFHLRNLAADMKALAFRDGGDVRFVLAVGRARKAAEDSRPPIPPSGLLSSGRRAATRAIAILQPSELIDAIIAILEKLSAIGPAARGKDLDLAPLDVAVDETPPGLVGIFTVNSDACSPRLSPSGLPALSPTRGVSGCGTDGAMNDPAVAKSRSTFNEGKANAPSYSPPLGGRWPAGQRGVPHDETSAAPPPTTLGLALPYRQATAATLTALADAAQSLGVIGIRLAPDHGLFAIGLRPGNAAVLCEIAATSGFITTPDDPRRSIALCAGSRGCASARYDTTALAEKLLALAPDLLDGSLDIHLSGCSKGCAHPSAAFLTFTGARAGYGLVVNGAASGVPATYIAENDIDVALERLQLLTRQSKENGETARACLERLGDGAIADALKLDGT